MEPTFFATPAAFRTWLQRHHAKERELLVGFYKKGSGRPSITWPEAVDQALCFGWIDGVRRRIDDASYSNRFTPRTPTSIWSAVNIKRANQLIDLGLMRPAGLKAFEARADERSAIYAYEQRSAARLGAANERSAIYAYEQRSAARLGAANERLFRANARAWTFFQAQPQSYRRTAAWWVISAKREETRARRLEQLIQDSEHGRTVPPLTRPTPSRPG